MSIRNNNSLIIKKLAKTIYKKNRARNNLLIIAITCSITLIFSIFTISLAQIKTEYILSAREQGSLITIRLDNATTKQYESIKNLEYIDDFGKESVVCTGMQNEEVTFLGKVVDSYGFENFYVPVYDKLHGTYPKNKNEVMLPLRVLRKLNITPKIGQEIPLTFMNHANSSKMETSTFILSGYFEDFARFADQPDAFFSKSYLDSLHGDTTIQSSIIMKQNNTLSSSETEKRLYRDIKMKNNKQKFFLLDTIEYKVASKIFGNYDTVLLLLIIILTSVYLLINNITQMSLEKDIREFGLLRTLGTTKSQIYRIQQRQYLYLTILGILFGIILSIVAINILLPTFLTGMITKDNVQINNVLDFNINLLLIIILITFIITFISMITPLRKVFRISPKNALYFTFGNYTIRKKEIHHKEKISLQKMALRNITTNKGKLLKIILSLFFSCILCISSVIIIQILDYSDIYKENADFELNEMDGGNPDHFINNAFIQDTSSIKGVENIDFSYQAYANFNMSQPVFDPLMTMSDHPSKDFIKGGLQIVRNDEIESLSNYLEASNIDFDIQDFTEGKSVFNLHRHVFSNKMQKEAMRIKNENIKIYNDNQEVIGEFHFNGYLDYTAKNFPIFRNMSTNSNFVPYILISEKGFEKLSVERIISKYYINVERGKEKDVHLQLDEYIEQRKLHHKANINPSIILNVKYVNEKKANDYINSIKTLYFSISLVFMILAILNYFNVMHTSLTNRKRELVVLESIGMTRFQLRKLLIYEGLAYCSIVVILLISVGTSILYYISEFVQLQRIYSSFSYPTTAVLILIIVIVFISISLPLLIYKSIERKSIIERLYK